MLRVPNMSIFGSGCELSIIGWKIRMGCIGNWLTDEEARLPECRDILIGW